MYINGMGFRAIQRVKEVGKLLLNAYDREIIPEIGELDELETFVGSLS